LPGPPLPPRPPVCRASQRAEQRPLSFLSLSLTSAPSQKQKLQTLPVVAPECPLAGLFGDATFSDIDIVAFEGEDDSDEDDELECEEEEDAKGPSPPSKSSSFAAHRAVLAAASPYFRSMLSSGFAESRTGTVELRGVSPSLLELLLKFCYGGRLAAVPRASLLPLAALADRLDVPALRSAVDAAIDADLGPATAAEYATAAAAMMHRYGGGGFCGGGGGGANDGISRGTWGGNAREALLDRCLDALCSEFSAAAAEPAFLALDERTLASVLEREDLVAASEAEVFDAVCRWALAPGGGGGGAPAPRLARGPPPPGAPSSSSSSSSTSPASSSSAFERLCRRVRFGSMAPGDLAAAAASPPAQASAEVQSMVLRAFVHIHAPRKPLPPGSAPAPSVGGGGGAPALLSGAAAAFAAARLNAVTAAALVLHAPTSSGERSGGSAEGGGRGTMEEDLSRAAAASSSALLPPATPPLDHLEPLAAADAAAQEEQQQQEQRQRRQKLLSSSASSFGGDSVSLPPRGGAGARLRLRVVVADGACSWPLDPSAPACPPGRHCGCPPATAGARPRGLSLTMPRGATVGALKLRACRDLGLDPTAFSLFDFYNGQKYGRGALCGSGDDAGGGGEGLTCGAADLRDGQLVLLELRG
jgi:hypothetical protein